MKIYTKRGDKGQTDLFNKRVSKADQHMMVNGTLDESMGVILMAKHYIRIEEVIKDLDQIHAHLFSMAHEIALNDPEKSITTPDNVSWIESRLDYYDSFLQPLTRFIKLDQTKAGTWLNLARVTVRRAERELVRLGEDQLINEFSLQYINRLSDFLFTLARYFDEVQ